jgi:hypothetical protein
MPSAWESCRVSSHTLRARIRLGPGRCQRGMPMLQSCWVARENKDTLLVRRGLRHDDSIPILDMYCSANSFPVAPFSRDCSVVSGAALKVLHLPDRGRSIFAD